MVLRTVVGGKCLLSHSCSKLAIIFQFCLSVNSLVFKIAHCVLSSSVLFAQYVSCYSSLQTCMVLLVARRFFPPKWMITALTSYVKYACFQSLMSWNMTSKSWTQHSSWVQPASSYDKMWFCLEREGLWSSTIICRNVFLSLKIPTYS